MFRQSDVVRLLPSNSSGGVRVIEREKHEVLHEDSYAPLDMCTELRSKNKAGS